MTCLECLKYFSKLEKKEYLKQMSQNLDDLNLGD